MLSKSPVAGFLTSTAVYHFQAVGGSFQAKNPVFLLDLVSSVDLLSDVIILDNSHKKKELNYDGREHVICSLYGVIHIMFLSQEKQCLHSLWEKKIPVNASPDILTPQYDCTL